MIGAKPINMEGKTITALTNALRIVAGQWRGRKIQFIDAEGLRPTPNRVKETLFNWVAPMIQEATILDIFAGSGSLGFESLSRGAKKVIFVEINPKAIKQLKSNCELLRCQDRIELLHMRAEDYLEKTQETFDLIFLDPPYHHHLIEPCAEIISRRKLLNPGGYLYIESEYAIETEKLPGQWEIKKQKKAGQVHYQLLRLATTLQTAF
ncbi:MAG: 16S rRNA (guanine(966)-N(2))-methyltransferase RsmD [Gammaproteobacteria bacterium]|nr:16S rRNA (guanine(966)-N(2))-methyltransferase RsmD [Gammaproteobacteria bacterium]MBU2546656.1 16S rRNA (guanine(966)-N(2))-methyltransferase RsmD [Gammaproteobacteria bacterium]